MRVLLAFDKFKDSLSAPEACAAVAEALTAIHPQWQIETAPLSDGGNGFAHLLTVAAGGKLHTQTVTGPLGEPAAASFGCVEIGKLPASVRAMLDLPSTTGELVVLEMAEASGLHLVPYGKRDPWQCSTRGTGELLALAAARKPVAILMGIGGSATHDLALGALEALGLRGNFGNSATSASSLTPGNWTALQGFSGTLPTLPPLWIASDVSNPLLGQEGAAAVFAPQKGLRPEDLSRLEEQTARVAGLLSQFFHRPESWMNEPGSGAAGGFGFGMRCAFRARLTPGFELVREWLELDAKLARADLVITGEGSFDRSSLGGKGPGSLVRAAAADGKRCLVLAGRISLPFDEVQRLSCEARAITPPGYPLAQALAEAREWLQKAVRESIGKFPP
jgi:glycerate 2-kinase